MRLAKIFVLRVLQLLVIPLAALERVIMNGPRASGASQRLVWGWTTVLASGVLWFVSGPFFEAHYALYRDFGYVMPAPTQLLFDHVGAIQVLPWLLGTLGIFAGVTRRGPLQMIRVSTATAVLLVAFVVIALSLPFIDTMPCLK